MGIPGSKGVNLLQKILGGEFTNIFLRETNTRLIARKLISRLYIMSRVPPFGDLLPGLVAAIFEHPSKRITIIEDFIARKGLLSRVWIESKIVETNIKKCLGLIRSLSPEEIIKVLAFLIEKGSSTGNFEIRLRLLTDILFVLEASVRDASSQESEITPSSDLLSILETIEKLEVSPRNIFDAFFRTICKYWPQNVIDEINLVLRLLFGYQLREASSTLFSDVVSKKSPEAIRVLEFIIILGLIPLPLKFVRETLRLRLVVFLLRRYITGDIPSVVGLLRVLQLTASLDRTSLLNLLTILRFASIHGGFIALKLLEDIFPESDLLRDAAVAILVFASLRDHELSTIVSLAIKRNRAGLKLINDILLKSTLKPHGIVASVPWELYGTTDKLLKTGRAAIKYFRDSHVAPPRRLVRLVMLLKQINEAINLRPREIHDILNLKEKLELLLEVLGRGHEFASDMKRSFGVLPGFFKILNSVSKAYKKLGEKWSYILLREYHNQLAKNPQLFVTSILDTEREKDIPTIYLIIDGLRYDDLILRLLPKLRRCGFRLISQGSKISLLPSITTISRRGIMLGRPPQSFALSPKSLKKEEEIILSRFGPEVEAYYGPIAVIYNRFTTKEKHSDRIIIVLSELEKSMHGASESVLAHFVDEYLNNIAELLMHIAVTLTRRNKKIRVILSSDHGLGIFPKFYDPSSFLDTLVERRAIDYSLEPLIRERYAFIPLRDVQTQMVVQHIYNSDDEFRSAFWLIPAELLGFREIEFYSKGTKLITKTKIASQVVAIFPKGNKKFLRGRGAIYHGGLSPEETLSAYAVLEYET